MPRDPSRKAAKRKPPRPKLDDDLVELAVALAQYEIDEGCAGWLKMPWKNGWNAAQFALDVSTTHPTRPFAREVWLCNLIAQFHQKPFHHHERNSDRTQENYWHIQEFLEVESIHLPMLRAAYRCAQVMLTLHGAGDGTIFNAILTQPLLSLGWASAVGGEGSPAKLALWAASMEHARCRDVLGIEPTTQNDANDWLRSAFRIAWRRRLYVAAYALPPAVLVNR